MNGASAGGTGCVGSGVYLETPIRSADIGRSARPISRIEDQIASITKTVRVLEDRVSTLIRRIEPVLEIVPEGGSPVPEPALNKTTSFRLVSSLERLEREVSGVSARINTALERLLL